MEIKITDDGLFGQSVNPFPKYHYHDMLNEDFEDFEKDNPPYPLTEQGEPCKVCEAGLVWQIRYLSNQWITQPKNGFNTFSEFEVFWLDRKTRQAFEVISNKEEMPEKKATITLSDGETIICGQTCGCSDNSECELALLNPVAEQSIDKLRKKLKHEAVNPESDTWHIEADYFDKGFMAAISHILNAKGLVSKDKIVEITDCKRLELYNNHCTIGILNLLTDLLNKIKEL